MYRFLVIRGTPPQTIYLKPKETIMQRSMQLCSFCKFHHHNIPNSFVYHQTRTASTLNLLGQQSSIKQNKRQKVKRSAELLEVSDVTATNKKAAVQKLSVNHLSVLARQPGITTDKVKDFAYKKHSHKIHANPNKMVFPKAKSLQNGTLATTTTSSFTTKCGNEDSAIFEDITELDETDLLDKSQVDNLESGLEKVKGTVGKKPLKQTRKSFKAKFAQESYIENLLPYMHVYINCGLVDRAHKTLMLYRKIMSGKLNTFNRCVHLYNIVLEAYASTLELDKMLHLYTIMKTDLVSPTPQSYGLIFSAFGRIEINKEQIKILKTVEDDMVNYNISFDDIFIKSHLVSDQQDSALKSVRILHPTFVPPVITPNHAYNCKLVENVSTIKNAYNPAKGAMTLKELQNLFQKQIRNEYESEVEIESIDSHSKDDTKRILNETDCMTKIDEVEQYWEKAVIAAFDKNLQYLKNKERQSHKTLMVLHPFLEVLDKKHYVNAILHEIRQLAQSSDVYSMSLTHLYLQIGRHIYTKYEIYVNEKCGVIEQISNIYLKYLEYYLQPEKINQTDNMNSRIIWQKFEHEERKCAPLLGGMFMLWTRDTLLDVGKFLYNIILNDVILKPSILKGYDLQHSIPAFYTLFRNAGTYLVEQIKSHPSVTRLYKEAHHRTITFSTNLLPSHTPPRPWISIYKGGYLITQTKFIRIPDNSSDPWNHLKRTKKSQLYPIFDSLNQLGSVPWIINTPILDIVIKIFRNGGSLELNIPQASAYVSPPPAAEKTSTEVDQQETKKIMAQYKRDKEDMYSLWCDTLYRLSIANHFRDSIFWFPHNLDFRGRVYPVPPHLNHLASDLGRSLLLFAQTKPLGPNGLDWLIIHVVNLTGTKKSCSLAERLQYGKENLDNILDSAANPLTGKMWWSKSDEPWQTLAACMEIAKVLKSPNPEEYESHFPVHQDGSCNGLQHYAALGRDDIGAKSVNLDPSDVPQDVYAAVAAIVEKKRKVDAANNNPIAKMLDGFVKRKVIKQTVMTTVYGVTKYGAKLQIFKQLEDIENFPQQYVWPASLYLTDSTFQSLRTMFKSAKDIQDWFSLCARNISYVCSQNVEWITPLGFPVTQSYAKNAKTSESKPDTLKQKNAFAPNFIHSLDSTHMMLTSLHCERANVTFVSVHDCFWTHACSVNTMNNICRQQFVALHSEPILEHLSKFFINHYAEHYGALNRDSIYKCFRSVPKTGNFDIKNVLSSIYFFN